MRYKTLKRNGEFHRAYSRGKSCVGGCLVTYAIKKRTGPFRVGITSSKKIGNAVARNRARRVIRAALAQVLPNPPQGYDVVFVARAATAKKKSWQVARVMRRQLAETGVLEAEGEC
ncbi:MAG: ribonuclease P protein component [Oscillospiraceae bacterium]|nr:ribonuclease P protein component [Oscillospiraceae bacterium]